MISRAEQAKETKEKIHQAAITLFKNNNFDDVTIAMISKAAGVSKGLFYNYFPTKESVLIEHSRITDYGYKELLDSLSEDSTTLQNLFAYADKTTQILDSAITPIVYADALKHPDTSYMLNESRYAEQLITHIIKRGQEKGEIRTDCSVKLLVDTILSVSWGSYFAYHIRTTQENSETVYGEVLKQQLKILYEGVKI